MSAIFRSASVKGRSDMYSVFRTYGTSEVWNAPYRSASGPGIA